MCVCFKWFSPFTSLCLHMSAVVLAPELNVTSPSNNTIVATWPPVEHAVRYTLSIIQEGSSTRHKVNTTDTAVTFDGLEAGTTYCIKSTAWDSEGRPGDDITECQITRRQNSSELNQYANNPNVDDSVAHFLVV